MYKKSKISRNITAPYITILIYICTSAMPRAEKVQQKVIFERRQQCSLVVYVIISLWVSFTLSNSATFKGTLSRETQSCAWRHSYGTRANIRHLQLRQSLCETCANFFGCPPLTRTWWQTCLDLLHLQGTEEGWNYSKGQGKGLCFCLGGQNLFNFLPRLLFCLGLFGRNG